MDIAFTHSEIRGSCHDELFALSTMFFRTFSLISPIAHGTSIIGGTRKKIKETNSLVVVVA